DFRASPKLARLTLRAAAARRTAVSAGSCDGRFLRHARARIACPDTPADRAVAARSSNLLLDAESQDGKAAALADETAHLVHAYPLHMGGQGTRIVLRHETDTDLEFA